MTTTFSIALIPLALLALTVAGIVIGFIKLGAAGRVAMLVAAVVVFCGVAFLRVQARSEALSTRSTGMNVYPRSPDTLVSSNHSSLADEVHRTVAEVKDNVARQRAELREKLAEQQAETREHLRHQQDIAATQPSRALTDVPAPTIRPMPSMPSIPPIPSLRMEPSASEDWKSAADLGFDADVHPSAAAAAEALVVQMLKLKDASHPDAAIKRVQLWGGDGIDGEVLSRAVSRLQRVRPEWQVMVEAAEPGDPLEKGDPEAASIHIELPTKTTTHNAPWDSSRAQIGGILRLRMTWQGGSIDRSTNFTNKPWVENTSQFISEKPQMRWLVGFSPQDTKDNTEARTKAICAAARQLTPEIQKLIESRSAGRAIPDPRWLAQQIEQQLWAKRDVRDEFTQTLITPYGGQVTRQAILVQSPALVQRVASGCFTKLDVQRKTWMTVIASAGGLLLLVCVVGVLLNNVTKGYYRGRILTITGLLAIVGLMLFLKLVSMHNSGFL